MKDTSRQRDGSARYLLRAIALVVAIHAASFAQQAMAASAAAGEPTSQSGWVATGNLHSDRLDHTATLLPSGKVLVVGGAYDMSGWGDYTSPGAELYDPAAGSWTRTGSPNGWYAGHTATLLSDGRVLVVGGVQLFLEPEPRPPVAELYDSAIGTWTPTASLNYLHSGHTATRMADGRVLVAGGQYSYYSGDYPVSYTVSTEQSKSEVYDPVTDQWTPAGSFLQRSSHTATLLDDGRILVLGGANGSSSYGVADPASPSAVIYDPRTGVWAAAGELAFPRYGHTATLLPSGRVLVTGGFGVGRTVFRTAEIFDPATGTSRAVEGPDAPRIYGVATPLTDGTVLVTGGVSARDYGIVANAETYEPTSGKWLPAGQQITPRFGHTATLLQDGRVLVAGGASWARVEASAELWGPMPTGSIRPGFTGSWYDPAQIGHGLFVEVLPDNKFLAAWFTFDPAGTKQAWFVGTGTYAGNTATLTAMVQPTGGRWIPNFDPAQVVNSPWGTLKFTFTDCNHGRVEFASIAGYGTGSMNLTRLTQPAGLVCQ